MIQDVMLVCFECAVNMLQMRVCFYKSSAACHSCLGMQCDNTLLVV